MRAAVAEDGPDRSLRATKMSTSLGGYAFRAFFVSGGPCVAVGLPTFGRRRWSGLLINRLLHAVAVLFGVVSVTFALLHLAGDPLAGLIPPGAAPEVERQIRIAYGLDRPLPEQYLDFVGHAMRGDFGDSWRQGRPALGAVLERLPATLCADRGGIPSWRWRSGLSSG